MFKSLPTRFFFSFFMIVMSASLLLTACTGQGSSTYKPWNLNQREEVDPNVRVQQTPPQQETLYAAPIENVRSSEPIKVALLLPLSGKNAGVGQALLNAAQMAVFDVGGEHFELMPRDTKGTPAGASEAAQGALSEGASLILGPLFSPNVRAVKPIALSKGVNVIGLSTDWTLSGNNTFILGFTPFDQVERVMRYAGEQGIKTVGVLAPDNQYGRGVASAANQMTNRLNMTVTKSAIFNVNNMQAAVTSLAEMKKQNPTALQTILMPLGGGQASAAAAALTSQGLTPDTVRRLGTGLMDDENLARDAAMNGTWFAAPSPKLRRNFETRYRQTYDTAPLRISTLAYDATALAAILARQNLPYSKSSLMNPNGFFGIDGIFRFRSNGLAERGLAVLEFRRGTIVITDPAPQSFSAYAQN